MKKVIQDMAPWNDFYFKNCYYSALFAILLHYKKNIAPIMMNDIFFYETPEVYSKKVLNYRHQEICPCENIIRDMGICEKVYTHSRDTIVPELKKSIDSNVPVMLFIDCFYQSMRPDAFNLNHWPHIVTVYGYDDEMEAFLILEHKYEDGFDYDKRLLVYRDVPDCYKGFLDNIREKDSDFGGYIEFHQEDSKDERLYSSSDVKHNFKVIAEKTLEFKEKFLTGINLLEGFIKQIPTDIGYDIRTAPIYSLLIADYNELILSKLTENQRLFEILGQEHPASILAEELCLKWTYVFGLANKQRYSEQLIESFSNAIVNTLKQISQLEKNYFNEFFKVIEEWRT